MRWIAEFDIVRRGGGGLESRAGKERSEDLDVGYGSYGPLGYG